MTLSNSIVIFGGSFDPPHFGHATVCLWLMSALNAKGVVVAPTFEHCFGKKLIDFKHRVKMCRLMCKYINAPYIGDFIRHDRGKIIITEVESELPAPNITYNLLNKVKKFKSFENNDFAVVIGSDLVPDLHKWSKWDKVSKMARVIAVGRSGFKSVSTPLDIEQYPVDLSAISSSEIRDKISKGEPITGLVTHNVERYIYENNLYRT